MDRLIPIINKLQDVFTTLGYQPIDLPQIAVVGSQSVGKSSVLENIVGRDFLPRGTDIVTRRPLILQLINTSKARQGSVSKEQDNMNNSDGIDLMNENKNEYNNEITTTTTTTTATNEMDDSSEMEWGEFFHIKDKRFYDFNDIRKEIEKETDRVAPSKAVSEEPINLKIYSPKVLNLTLVDLPGLTKVAVGNQPENIEQIITDLVYSFIKRPKCLILAVSSATSDLATSDGLQLALKIDPKGVRTLGVITKLDLMDQGTDAMKILNGEVIPLQLGYIGVVNRSQQNINDRINIAEALRNEERFFKNHRVYRSIAHMCGIPCLAKRLNQILINHIKVSLPFLKEEINKSIATMQNELASYGEPLSAKEKNKGALLLQLISKFSDNFNSAIDGSGVMMLSRQKSISSSSSSSSVDHYNNSSFRQQSQHPANKQANQLIGDLFGGARILYIFRTEFQKNLSFVKPFDELSDDFILNSMRNASGIRSSLFIPEMCFENLVKIQIEKLRRPSVHCVEMVFEELKRITGQCQTAEISRFPKFRIALSDCVIEMLKKHLEPCRVFVNQLIDIELSYINTNHPDFISMDDVFNEFRNTSNKTHPSSSIDAMQQSTRIAQPSTSTSSSLVVSSVNPNVHSNGSVQSQSSNPNQSQSQSQSQSQASKTQKAKKPAEPGLFSFGMLGMGGRAPNGPVTEEREREKEKEKEKEKGKDSTTNQWSDTQLQLQSANPFEQAPVDHHSSYQINSNANTYFQSNSGNRFQNKPTQRECLELLVIKRFIESYFEIVKKNITDIVPKSIMQMLINLSKERLQQYLALTLYREEKFEELLSENPEIAKKRKEVSNLLSILKKSMNIINEVSDYKPSFTE